MSAVLSSGIGAAGAFCTTRAALPQQSVVLHRRREPAGRGAGALFHSAPDMLFAAAKAIPKPERSVLPAGHKVTVGRGRA